MFKDKKMKILNFRMKNKLYTNFKDENNILA